MNEENQNQNLNPVTPEQPTVTPSAGPMPMPNPAPVPPSPVEPPMPGAAPVPPVGPAPQVEPIAPATPDPAVTPTPIPPAPPANDGAMPNLQPEGTVIPTPPPAPAPEVAQPLMGASLNSQTVLNQANPTDMNNNAPMGGAPMPGNGMMPPNMNLMGGIPTPPNMPPETNETNKKKPNMTLIVVLAIVLVAAVGFGVYYFLNMSKAKAPSAALKPTLTIVELGSEIDVEDPKAFADIPSSINLETCSVETDLNPMETGSYQYTVTCGNLKIANQPVRVDDSTAPEVVPQDVTVALNADVDVEDFIFSVKDFSDYTISFDPESEEIDTSVAGEYKVYILVTDDCENVTKVEGNLIVSEDAPEYYLACEEVGESSQFSKADVSYIYRYGIKGSGELAKTVKSITYTFKNTKDYQDAVAEISEDYDEFDGISGKVTENEDDRIITVSLDYDISDLEDEYSISPFPSTEMEIEDFYDENGISCYMD